jgi:heat shock protein HslJ
MRRQLIRYARALSLVLVASSMGGCAVDPNDDLAGTWRPVQLLGRDYSNFKPLNGDVTIEFDGSNGWSANDSCNEVSGRLLLGSHGSFHAEATSSSDVGCDLKPAEALPNVTVLQQATVWRLNGETLVFEGDDGTVLGTYRP